MKKIKIKNFFALVDDSDFERVSSLKWRLVGRVNKSGAVIRYAITHKTLALGFSEQGSVYMHRLILSAPSHLQVDHINGDGLDNRRENIRLVTRSQNIMNTVHRCPGRSKYTKFKGVHWSERDKHWRVRIRFQGKLYYFGSNRSEKAAAKMHDDAAKKLIGSLAVLNFPEK